MTYDDEQLVRITDIVDDGKNSRYAFGYTEAKGEEVFIPIQVLQRSNYAESGSVHSMRLRQDEGYNKLRAFTISNEPSGEVPLAKAIELAQRYDDAEDDDPDNEDWDGYVDSEPDKPDHKQILNELVEAEVNIGRAIQYIKLRLN
tara:strand:+ start:9693 stop:10127 length:435 start_codon:yes stop_codon:yes gene_type:complete